MKNEVKNITVKEPFTLEILAAKTILPLCVCVCVCVCVWEGGGVLHGAVYRKTDVVDRKQLCEVRQVKL